MRLIYFFIILIVFSCNSQNSKRKKEIEIFQKEVLRRRENRKKEILKNIEGRDLFSLKNVINDSILSLNEYNFILLYNGADCFTCIERSFQLLSDLENRLELSFLVIGTNTNVSNEQINYNYSKYIYYDAEEQIRRELSLVPTPIMLVINKKFKIEKACFPHVNEGLEEQEEFINYLYSIMNFVIFDSN